MGVTPASVGPVAVPACGMGISCTLAPGGSVSTSMRSVTSAVSRETAVSAPSGPAIRFSSVHACA